MLKEVRSVKVNHAERRKLPEALGRCFVGYKVRYWKLYLGPGILHFEGNKHLRLNATDIPGHCYVH